MIISIYISVSHQCLIWLKKNIINLEKVRVIVNLKRCIDLVKQMSSGYESPIQTYWMYNLKKQEVVCVTLIK